MITFEQYSQFLKGLDGLVKETYTPDFVAMARDYYAGQGMKFLDSDDNFVLKRVEDNMEGELPYALVEIDAERNDAEVEIYAGGMFTMKKRLPSKMVVEFSDEFVSVGEQGKPYKVICKCFQDLQDVIVGNIALRTMASSKNENPMVLSYFNRVAIGLMVPGFEETVYETNQALIKMMEDQDIPEDFVALFYITDFGGKMIIRSKNDRRDDLSFQFSWGFSSKEPDKYSWNSNFESGTGAIETLKNKMKSFVNAVKKAIEDPSHLVQAAGQKEFKVKPNFVSKVQDILKSSNVRFGTKAGNSGVTVFFFKDENTAKRALSLLMDRGLSTQAVV